MAGGSGHQCYVHPERSEGQMAFTRSYHRYVPFPFIIYSADGPVNAEDVGTIDVDVSETRAEQQPPIAATA